MIRVYVMQDGPEGQAGRMEARPTTWAGCDVIGPRGLACARGWRRSVLTDYLVTHWRSWLTNKR